MRYRRAPSASRVDVTESPSFFFMVPDRKPRTLWACQSVAATSSFRVAPSRRARRSRHRCCLLVLAGTELPLGTSIEQIFLDGSDFRSGSIRVERDLPGSADLRGFEGMVGAPDLGYRANRDACTTSSPACPRGTVLRPNRPCHDDSNACCAGEVHMWTVPFCRKFELWDRITRVHMYGLCSRRTGRWPRWVPHCWFQPVEAVSLCRWTSRSVPQYGPTGHTIFDTPCNVLSICLGREASYAAAITCPG